ncbi:methyl-accepting chemotaxis protein [Paenibacillus sp. GD4]|uniref:methyl-accepting chemotaxis protein n=1 Tax=Paenibacillus sp. GD4 TaxID=3068890 RepID=UPI0027969AB3|nr:methyl-accepting chemotaxis protein [Paenibacillus sp. GD4]MDQ1909947.1 methyl-accepting chemotaxis protein [Paenibacillus sp. GD4]
MTFGLVKKFVLGLTAVSAITYGTSAFFIFVLKDQFTSFLPEGVFIAVTLAMGIGWTGFLGWLMAKWIVSPLLLLTKLANEAAEGNLAISLPAHRSKDELGVLNEAFRSMVRQLRGLLQDITKHAIAANESSAALSEAILQATYQAEQISAINERIAHGAEQQKEEARLSFLAMEQVSLAASEVSEEAGQTNRLSAQMVRTIEESSEVIRTLVHTMLETSRTGEGTIEVVAQLERDALEIGSVTRLVGEIADQTHLLALNASIEAARAGEEGRGFSVVAMEIRKLAEQSSQSVHAIDELIRQVQLAVEDVADRLKRQVESMQREASKGEQTEHAIRRMSGSAQETASAVQLIAATIAEQSQQIYGAEQKQRSIDRIALEIVDAARQAASSTQEQTAVMQEIASSSEVLKRQSEILREKSAAFRT